MCFIGRFTIFAALNWDVFFLGVNPKHWREQKQLLLLSFFSTVCPHTHLRYKLKHQKNVYHETKKLRNYDCRPHSFIISSQIYMKSTVGLYVSTWIVSCDSVIRAATNRKKTLGHPTVWLAAKQSPAQQRIELKIQSRQSREVVSGHKCWTLRFEKINCEFKFKVWFFFPAWGLKKRTACKVFFPLYLSVPLKCDSREIWDGRRRATVRVPNWRVPQSERKPKFIDDLRVSSIEWKLQGQ